MATKTKTDVVEYAWRLLHDVGDTAAQQYLTNETLEDFIDMASRIYSKDRPRVLVDDLSADGSNLTALPGAWVEGFSRLVALETPTGNIPPTIIDPRAYTLYRDAAEQDTILWYSGAPGSGQTVRASWTALHTVGADSADTTVPDADFEAISALTASIGAEAISAKFAQDSDALVTADRASRATSQSEEWMRIARRLRSLYSDSLGLPRDGRRVASGWANWDSRDSRRRDWLTHPRRYA